MEALLSRGVGRRLKPAVGARRGSPRSPATPDWAAGAARKGGTFGLAHRTSHLARTPRAAATCKAQPPAPERGRPPRPSAAGRCRRSWARWAVRCAA
jgi:hypothetical protein